MNKLVAVFGSLREGFGNHRVLGNSEKVGVFKSPPKFKMLSAGGFPYLLKSEQGKEITMEVYRVTDERISNNIDCLEGYHGPNHRNNFYDKDYIETPFGIAEYYYNEHASGPEVESGDWANR